MPLLDVGAPVVGAPVVGTPIVGARVVGAPVVGLLVAGGDQITVSRGASTALGYFVF